MMITENLVFIGTVLFNYLLLPFGILILCAELWFTKRRANRYEKALHNMADQDSAVGADRIKMQRDSLLTEARMALYMPKNHVKDDVNG